MTNRDHNTEPQQEVVYCGWNKLLLDVKKFTGVPSTPLHLFFLFHTAPHCPNAWDRPASDVMNLHPKSAERKKEYLSTTGYFLWFKNSRMEFLTV